MLTIKQILENTTFIFRISNEVFSSNLVGSSTLSDVVQFYEHLKRVDQNDQYQEISFHVNDQIFDNGEINLSDLGFTVHRQIIELSYDIEEIIPPGKFYCDFTDADRPQRYWLIIELNSIEQDTYAWVAIFNILNNMRNIIPSLHERRIGFSDNKFETREINKVHGDIQDVLKTFSDRLYSILFKLDDSDFIDLRRLNHE